MKIRIFALAKDLALDSKELIELCGQAGIHLKNSALASITPEERDVLLNYIENHGTQSVAEPEPEQDQDQEAPVRESTSSTGKVRAISTATRQRTLVESQTAAEDQIDDNRTANDMPARPVEAGAESSAEDSAATPDGLTSGAQPGSVTRDDYVSSAGGPVRPVREMKPIGTIQDREAQPERRTVAKSKGALPNIAAPPSYKPPISRERKPSEQRVQKPDMPLTADALEKKSPLADRLEQHKRGDGDQPRRGRTGGPLDRRGKRQSLTQQLKESRAAEKQKLRMRRPKRRRSGPVELKTSAQIDAPITVRSLSEAIGRPAKMLIGHLLKQNRPATINEQLTEDEALEIALEMGVDLEIKRRRDIEAELMERLGVDEREEDLVERPPIITILGHVDHGKTTLVDRIREADVAGGEAGGITQHIAAYQVEHNNRKLTFVDTPGHAAFGEMRARGANVTDIVVLVVAADDGIMPQTEECISHAKSAGVPIVVAMNKIDLANADQNKVLVGLSNHGVQPTEWGGEIDVVRTSALNGEGIEDLLEHLLLTAELEDFRAAPDRPALGVCLEGFRDEGRGALAWLIVRQGTLRVGDTILCGTAFGRIRAMYNDRDEEIMEAPPSTPVKVAGLGSVPQAGSHFFVMQDVEEARSVAQQRAHEGREEGLVRLVKPRSLDELIAAVRDGAGVQDLPLIIKADTPGSIEALRSEVEQFEHPEVRVQIIHEGVGGVNESDVYLASASGAIIVAFHVIAEDRAATLAEREGVDIRRYDIIYEVTEQIKLALEGLLRPEEQQVATGRAVVLQTFQISRFGTIAGCRVLTGSIARDSRVHVIRDQRVLNDYRIASLKREKDDAKDVRDGMECGIRLDGFNDIKQGDLLEAFRVDVIRRTLDG